MFDIASQYPEDNILSPEEEEEDEDEDPAEEGDVM